jgi:hypothetical protein
MSEKIKVNVSLVDKMFKATHKISIYGFRAYMDIKSGSIRGTNKTITLILKIIIVLINFWREEQGKPELKVKIIEDYKGKKLI